MQNNLLPNQWQGAPWGDGRDNGIDGPGKLSVDYNQAPGQIPGDGLVHLPVIAAVPQYLWFGGGSETGNPTGYIEIGLANPYNAAVQFMSDVELTEVELAGFINDDSRYLNNPEMTAEMSTAAPGEVHTLVTENSPYTEQGTDHGTMYLKFKPSGDGTVKVNVPYWGNALHGSPPDLEWPGGDPGEGDPDPDPGEGDPDPDPGEGDPDPDPGEGDPDEIAAELAPRVAGYIGRRGDPEAIEQIEGQLPIVVEFVKGYTRGNGFTEAGPNSALKACIISAAARLATNPEQVQYYTLADYSERPAQLTGFTMIEQRTLNNYRRVWA